MNPADSSYLAWLEAEDTNRQIQVQNYRSYYEGDPPTEMTDRQAAFLNLDRDKSFGANVCGLIVDAPVERLQVTGFKVTGKDEGDARIDVLAELLDTWWQQNRLDAIQDHVHRAALRDAESFVIVGYDNDKQRPQIKHDYAYDGTNGVKVHYKPGTYDEVMMASKRWPIEGGRRLNLYFDNRIEKWVSAKKADDKFSELGWRPLPVDAEDGLETAVLTDGKGQKYAATVAWWTADAREGGEPLGVPVIPFINRDDGTGRGLSELDNALPIQDGINKFYLDMLGSADMTGFGMFWHSGTIPDNVKIYPGAAIGVVASDENNPPHFERIPPGELSPLIEGMSFQVALLAGISGTPQSRFVPSVVRPAEGTKKQEESALIAKVVNLHKGWGNAWEDVMRMGLKLQRAFGQGGEAVPDDSGLLISTQWKDPEVRNEKEHVEAIAVKVEKLGIPQEQAWKEAGYSADEIREFKKIRMREQAEARLAEARLIAQRAQEAAAKAQQNGNQNGNSPPQEAPSEQQQGQATEEVSNETAPAQIG